MERGKAIVIDASVAIKWFNVGEHSDIADELKSKHIRGEINLVAPILLLFEVANALRYNPDFGSENVKEAVNDLIDLQIALSFPQAEWMEEAVEIAYLHGTPIYDACYIALAKYLRTITYTADVKLLEKVKEPNLKHISEAITAT